MANPVQTLTPDFAALYRDGGINSVPDPTRFEVPAPDLNPGAGPRSLSSVTGSERFQEFAYDTTTPHLLWLDTETKRICRNGQRVPLKLAARAIACLEQQLALCSGHVEQAAFLTGLTSNMSAAGVLN